MRSEDLAEGTASAKSGMKLVFVPRPEKWKGLHVDLGGPSRVSLCLRVSTCLQKPPSCGEFSTGLSPNR